MDHQEIKGHQDLWVPQDQEDSQVKSVFQDHLVLMVQEETPVRWEHLDCLDRKVVQVFQESLGLQVPLVVLVQLVLLEFLDLKEARDQLGQMELKENVETEVYLVIPDSSELLD